MRDLTLPIVLGAALIDSINPCAIGVILFLSSVLLKVSGDKRKLMTLGLVYIGTIYVIYLLSGLGLIWFQYKLIKSGFAEIVGTVVGIFVIGLGLIDIKDVFWYKKGISLEIPDKYRDKLTKMAENVSLLGVITFGAFAAIVELPCTGGPYLAITTLLAKRFDSTAFGYLLIYNFIFVLPLLVILFALYWGVYSSTVKRWRQEHRKWMNLATGLLMVSLGSFLIAYYRLGWHL